MMKRCNNCKNRDKGVEFCKDCVPVDDNKDSYYWSPSKWETTEAENPYWDRICKLSEKQRAKGMETYGRGLESNPAPILARINHIEEELIDGLMYLEWLKEGLMNAQN